MNDNISRSTIFRNKMKMEADKKKEIMEDRVAEKRKRVNEHLLKRKFAKTSEKDNER